MLLLQGLIEVFLRCYPSAQERVVEEFELQGLASFDMIQGSSHSFKLPTTVRAAPTQVAWQAAAEKRP